MDYLEPSDFSAIDSTHIKKLKTGKFSPDDIVDFHGMRLYEAEELFFDFIEDSYQQSYRYLLVITGKGSPSSGGGVIKNAVPNWLNSNPLRSKILAYTHASNRHGGTGAYYILLRK